MILVLVLFHTAAASEDRPYAVVPGLLISPEVGVGLGVAGFHAAWPGPGTRLEAKLLATTREQFQARLRLRHAGPGSPWEWRGEAEGLWFPDSWFGGGNAPASDDEHYYTPRGVNLSGTALRVLSGPFRALAGASWHAFRIGDWRKADGSPADPGVVAAAAAGRRGGQVGQLSLGVEWDSRDDAALPARGTYAGHRLGIAAGDFAFAAVETWAARHFAFGNWEAAGKVWQKTLTGEAPFFLEPYLGDENILRGVPHKRFRDRSAQAFQAELRWGFPLSLPWIGAWLGRHWQLAGFFEGGRVGTDFAAASAASPHFSGGAGGRLIVGRRRGVIRGDLAFSAHGAALIVNFNQAF